jgi:hypothetical protein
LTRTRHFQCRTIDHSVTSPKYLNTKPLPGLCQLLHCRFFGKPAGQNLSAKNGEPTIPPENTKLAALLANQFGSPPLL